MDQIRITVSPVFSEDGKSVEETASGFPVRRRPAGAPFGGGILIGDPEMRHGQNRCFRMGVAENPAEFRKSLLQTLRIHIRIVGKNIDAWRWNFCKSLRDNWFSSSASGESEIQQRKSQAAGEKISDRAPGPRRTAPLFDRGPVKHDGPRIGGERFRFACGSVGEGDAERLDFGVEREMETVAVHSAVTFRLEGCGVGVDGKFHLVKIEPGEGGEAAVAVEIESDASVGHDVRRVVENPDARPDPDPGCVGPEAECASAGETGVGLNAGREGVRNFHPVKRFSRIPEGESFQAEARIVRREPGFAAFAFGFDSHEWIVFCHFSGTLLCCGTGEGAILRQNPGFLILYTAKEKKYNDEMENLFVILAKIMYRCFVAEKENFGETEKDFRFKRRKRVDFSPERSMLSEGWGRFGISMKKPQLKFLSHDVNLSLSDREHSHPYWQLEYVAGGAPVAICDGSGKRRELPPRTFVLIPPLTPHRFIRSGEGTETCSFKFTFEAESVFSREIRLYSASQPFFEWVAGQMEHLFAGSCSVLQRNLLLEYLLMDLLHFVFQGTPAAGGESPLFSRLYDLVHSRGREVNVSLAAEELNLTVSQLKYRFLCESRNAPERKAGTSVKRYIDGLLAELIEDYLKYSALTIGEIAKATRFPDIYSLSHFYKRMRGRAPTQHPS